jgi:ABC-type dipeptide/oligopeptide/nickel transport system permease component
VWSAARRDSRADLLVLAATALCLTIPAFGAAMVLTQVFSVRLGWLPVVGGGSLRHLVLPAVSLAVPVAAVITRVVRASMLDACRKPFYTAAQAKGLTREQVWRKHVLRNALIPVLSLVGVQFGHLLGGAFIIETLFAWPGLGRLTVQAIFDQDTPVVLGAVVLSALIFQLCNALVDLTQQALDPRLRES